MRQSVFGLAGFCAFLGLCDAAAAQICRPVSERARVGDVGCWIIAHGSRGQLAEPQVFWHLDTFPTRAAADAAKGPRGTVVESYDKVWLLTIEVGTGKLLRGGPRQEILVIREQIQTSLQERVAIDLRKPHLQHHLVARRAAR